MTWTWGWSIITNDFHAATRDLVMAHAYPMASTRGFSLIVDRLAGMVMYFTARRAVGFSFDPSVSCEILAAVEQKEWPIDPPKAPSQEEGNQALLSSSEEGSTFLHPAWNEIIELATAPPYVDFSMQDKLNVEASLARDLGLLLDKMPKGRLGGERSGEEGPGGEPGKDEAGGEAKGDEKKAKQGLFITNYEKYRIVVQAAALQAFRLFVDEIKGRDVYSAIVQRIGGPDKKSRRLSAFHEVVTGMHISILTEVEGYHAASSAASAAGKDKEKE